jgi:peptidoglycan/xylan/chitin deacetylase (PgdA/CDA1 family)
MPYSLNPPAGLAPRNVPQFVTIGFDDNAYSGLEGSNGQGGMKWALDLFRNRKNPEGAGNDRTYDGQPCRVSFYMAASYADAAAVEPNDLVKKSWRQAWTEGHEIGDHTYSHSGNLKRNPDQRVWETEIEQCLLFLTQPYQPDATVQKQKTAFGIGIDRRNIYGFRTPFLSYTHETFDALKKEGFLYDSSIEEGWQENQTGENYCWPYTLDHGSPGDTLIWNWPGIDRPRPIGQYSGLWELSLHPVVVPPDNRCEKYGIPQGLRKKIKEQAFWYDEAGGKLPGVDYNLFYVFRLNKEEALAILKYTFDLHYTGNRAPFSLGAHSDIYSSKYPLNGPTTYQDRQWVIEQFVDYVLTKPDVRIVPAYKIIDWCKHPMPLGSPRVDVAGSPRQQALKHQ